MTPVDSVGDLLRPVSRDLAREFDDVAVPAALAIHLAGDSGTARAAHEVAHPWAHGRARAVVLAGPGAMTDPYLVRGIRAFAARANVPVANTWGAKGLLEWDSPHHMGTCGLQADDFALLGFGTYDLVVATGVDAAESPEARFALAPVVHLEPVVLAHTPDVPRLHDEIPANELYTRLAAVARPGYVDESTPRHPARAVMDLKQSLPPAAVVFGQPGPAGLWLARTFPTDRPGRVCVPASARAGLAAALALAAAARGLDAVAVTTDPPDAATKASVDAAVEVAPGRFRLEAWGDDVDWSRTADLVAAAGPVVAWT
jgi:acetolactate synthase-1/2/3 large subunit